MSYAICTVVCGIEMPRSIRDFLDEVDGDYQDCGGFTKLYRGSGNDPAYAGVEIFHFDECKTLRAADLVKKLVATHEQVKAAKIKIEDAKQVLSEFMDEIKAEREMTNEEKESLLASFPQEPDVLLIWSSS